MRRLPNSVRFRTTLAAAAVVAILLVVGAVSLVRLQERAINHSIDAGLKLRADDIEALLANGTTIGDLDVTDDEVSAVQVFNGEGELVAASPNAARTPPMVRLRQAPGDRITSIDRVAFEDDPFRVLQRGAAGPDGDHIILVAGSPDDAQESARALTRLLSFGVPLTIALAAAGTWLLVGRALAPVESIRREVALITESELQRRVPIGPSRDEIGRLAETMNAMLARVETAYERQRSFVADAAHELRTPLASLRTQLEVGSSDEDRLAEVLRMQHLVNDLLTLAAAEADTGAIFALVDLDDVALEEVRRARTRDGILIVTTKVSAAAVRGDASQLARVVQNLLDNALRHANSVVEVSVSDLAGRVELVVSDDGPGVPSDQVVRVFERFARTDSGRSNEEGGAGLGLAIVSAIVTAHGGSIHVESSDSGGARFVAQFPLPA